MKRYRALKHIDFLRPGDDVPEKSYDAATLKRMLAKGLIVEAGQQELGQQEEEKPKAKVEAKSEKA